MSTTEHQAPGFSAIGATDQPPAPGPYSVQDEGSQIVVITRAADHEAGALCRMYRTDAEAHATARLFAAAPELLAALRDTRRELAELLTEIGGCDHSVGVCACRTIRAIDAAANAIFAATGRPEAT